MKKTLLTLMLAITPFVANATPIEALTCEPGGEFGSVVTVTLQKKVAYGTLTIKRQNATTDFTRDLTTFVGGAYKVDLAPKGGLTELIVQYKPNATDLDYTTINQGISCSNPPLTTGAPDVSPDLTPATNTAAPTITPSTTPPQPVPPVQNRPVANPPEEEDAETVTE